MSAPFVTLTRRVDITSKGKDKLEARLPGSCEVLGTAQRRYGRGEQDWIGWLVQVGAHREVVDTVTAARELLELWCGYEWGHHAGGDAS